MTFLLIETSRIPKNSNKAMNTTEAVVVAKQLRGGKSTRDVVWKGLSRSPPN